MRLTVEAPTVNVGTITFKIIGRPNLDELDGMTGILTLDVKKQSKKRSVDANAYCWLLLDKLSAVMRIPAAEIYRNTIREIGGVSQTVPIRNDAIPSWIKIWSSRGLGWVCEVLDACKAEGFSYVKCYYGSSVYDTKQMSRLIDCIVQDCKSVGIETMTPIELSGLLDRWEGDGDKKPVSKNTDQPSPGKEYA